MAFYYNILFIIIIINYYLKNTVCYVYLQHKSLLQDVWKNCSESLKYGRYFIEVDSQKRMPLINYVFLLYYSMLKTQLLAVSTKYD